MAKTLWRFGHSECNRVKVITIHVIYLQMESLLLTAGICPKVANGMANSLDSDQTVLLQSDLGLHGPALFIVVKRTK